MSFWRSIFNWDSRYQNFVGIIRKTCCIGLESFSKECNALRRMVDRRKVRSPKLAPKRTLSKNKIAEIYIIEIKIADIKIIEIKIAEFFRSFITNNIYFNDLISGDHFLRLLFKYLSYTWNLFTYSLKSTTDSCDYLNDGDKKKTLTKVSLILVSVKSILNLLLDMFQLSYWLDSVTNLIPNLT
jgi:hypothetical protein